MLESKIPYNYIEIENIVKKINENKVTLFLTTQKAEGLTTMLNSICNNLFVKNKKIAVIDLNTDMKNKVLEKKEVVLTLQENNLLKNNTDLNNYALYSFENDILSIEDKMLFFKDFPSVLEELKKEFDYIFFINTPMVKINKNNLQLNELKIFIDETFFIIKSNYISKIKLETAYNSISKAKINIDGVIVNDLDSFNLFDEIERQINKIHFLFPKSVLKKVKNYLKEAKYNNQL